MVVRRLRSAARESPLYEPYVRWKYRVSSRARRSYFTGMYTQNVWGDDSSRSGSGSNLENTATLRARLPEFLAALGIRSLVDVPCGDWEWMQHVDLSGLDHYLGGDVVPSLIGYLTDKHGTGDRRFAVMDAISDDIPRCDAVMVRDLGGHLEHAQVRRLVRNARRSGATWLLITNYPKLEANADISMGSWRPQNFELPPYRWPSPVAVLEEHPPDPSERLDKTLSAWRLADLGQV